MTGSSASPYAHPVSTSRLASAYQCLSSRRYGSLEHRADAQRALDPPHSEGIGTPSRDSRPRRSFRRLARAFGGDAPGRTRAALEPRAELAAESQAASPDMQGLIPNESSYALNLISKGNRIGRRGPEAPGFLGDREQKKCAHSVQM